MQELLLGIEPRPDKDAEWGENNQEIRRTVAGHSRGEQDEEGSQQRQRPQQHVSDDEAAKRRTESIAVDQTDIPCLHWQRLAALAPAHDEVHAHG